MRFARVGLLVFVVASMAACHRGPSEQEKQVMAQLARSMKTQCMGRYLVDLPDSFQWLNPDLTLYYGRDEHFKTLEVQVLDYRATPESVAKAVAARAAQVAADTNLGTGKSNLLAQVKEGDGHSTMLRYYSGTEGIAGIDHELHLLIGSAYVLVKGASYENVPALASADQDLTDAVESRMLKLATNIRPVTDPDKAGPGFCLGTVVVDSDNDYENADLAFGMAKHPDVTFDVWMDNQANAPDTLLERMKDFDAAADGKRLKIIRSGNLMFAGVPAQEKAAKIVEDREEYHFVLESMPELPSFSHEGVNISLRAGGQLSNGQYINATLTQGEVQSLWDEIIESFRPRPNAVRSAAR